MLCSGTKLKDLRKKAGFRSQTALADAIGVSRSAVYDWERGAYFPEGDNLFRLATALKVPVAYLIGEVSIPTEGALQRASCNVINIPLVDDPQRFRAVRRTEDFAAIFHGAKRVDIPRSFLRGPVLVEDRIFGLRIEGDGMTAAGIAEGYYAVINPLAEMPSGTVVFVICEGQCLMKWVYWCGDGSLELRSANIMYPPRFISLNEMTQNLCRIVGAVEGVWGSPRRGE